jgi:hypothetical protein
MAVDDPGYGAAMTTEPGHNREQLGTGSTLLREYLHTCDGKLGSTLRADRAIAHAASGHVGARGGTSLASRLEAQRVPGRFYLARKRS